MLRKRPAQAVQEGAVTMFTSMITLERRSPCRLRCCLSACPACCCMCCWTCACALGLWLLVGTGHLAEAGTCWDSGEESCVGTEALTTACSCQLRCRSPQGDSGATSSCRGVMALQRPEMASADHQGCSPAAQPAMQRLRARSALLMNCSFYGEWSLMQAQPCTGQHCICSAHLGPRSWCGVAGHSAFPAGRRGLPVTRCQPRRLQLRHDVLRDLQHLQSGRAQPDACKLGAKRHATEGSSSHHPPI